MIAFLLFVAAAFCFLLRLFHAHTGVDLVVLGAFFVAAGLALGNAPGWPRQ